MGRESGSHLFARNTYVPVSRKQLESIEINIKRDTGEFVPFEFRRVLLTFHSATESSGELLKSDIKKIFTPNHKLYQQYCVDQAKQKKWKLTSFSRCPISAGLWIRFHIQRHFPLGAPPRSTKC